MNTRNIQGTHSGKSAFGCFAFAFLATALSLSIIIAQSWSKGGPQGWRWLWVAFGIFSVLVVHALPAVFHGKHWAAWLGMSLIWVICTCFVVTGHVGFFLSLQMVAGDQRAENIKLESTEHEPKRTLLQISTDLAGVRNALAAIESMDCTENCVDYRIKVARLKNRERVLESEEAQFKRWQVANDRLQARSDAAREDPVTARLASWLHVTSERVTLVMGLLLAMVLEGVGCLCWFVYANRRDSKNALAVTDSVAPGVRPGVTAISSGVGRKPNKKANRDLETLIAEAKAGIEAGRLKPTVEGVRKFLHCGQAKAREVRATLVET